MVRTRPYYVAGVVNVPIDNTEKRDGSKWDGLEDMIFPESGSKFDQ